MTRARGPPVHAVGRSCYSAVCGLKSGSQQEAKLPPNRKVGGIFVGAERTKAAAVTLPRPALGHKNSREKRSK